MSMSNFWFWSIVSLKTETKTEDQNKISFLPMGIKQYSGIIIFLFRHVIIATQEQRKSFIHYY